nr:hypothetical protein [uncultured Cellulosilyticum sp.]
MIKEYTLKQHVIKSGLYGPQESYEDIDSVDVEISITTVNIVQDGVMYTKEQTIGLTLFDELEKNEKYSLWDGKDKCYDVVSFKPGRFTQLVLQEVI